MSYFPGSQLLVAVWRRDIVKARIRLVSEDLPPTRQDAIWSGIDCREWFIKILAEDFDAEMETIDRMIEAELRRRPTALVSDCSVDRPFTIGP